MIKILLVEDDSVIASGIKYSLELEGYDITHVTNVNDAIATLENINFNLAILDMQLPDGIGFEISDKLKTTTAIIFLTVTDDEDNIVKAFDNGASDYIIKPFRIRELTARIRRTLLNQSSNIIQTNIIRVGNVEINTDSGKVMVGENIVELTALEYRLLLIFANNRGILLSRSQILDKIWDTDGNFVEDNTLTVYIKRLREKLGTAIDIKTIRGIGYRVD